MCEQVRERSAKRAFHKFFENLNTTNLKLKATKFFLLIKEPFMLAISKYHYKCEIDSDNASSTCKKWLLKLYV